MRQERGSWLRVLPVALVFIAVMAYAVYTFAYDPALPVYSPSDFNPELVDSSLHNELGGHTIADFELRNQNGETITQNTYQNKVYVADFFFTRCPSICPVMTNHMEQLQNTFIDEADVMFLSMSVTPNLDSIPLLKEYARKHGVIDGKWHITTGDKKHIYALARKSYFAVVNEGDGGLQDFIHTPNFILVDRKKRIRGVYDGTKPDEIERLEGDLRKLL